MYYYCLPVCYNAFLEHLRLFSHLTKMLSISSLFPDFSKAVVSTVMVSMVLNTCADRNVNNFKTNTMMRYSFLAYTF